MSPDRRTRFHKVECHAGHANEDTQKDDFPAARENRDHLPDIFSETGSNCLGRRRVSVVSHGTRLR